jgi:hypothetical protein
VHRQDFGFNARQTTEKVTPPGLGGWKHPQPMTTTIMTTATTTMMELAMIVTIVTMKAAQQTAVWEVTLDKIEWNGSLCVVDMAKVKIRRFHIPRQFNRLVLCPLALARSDEQK